MTHLLADYQSPAHILTSKNMDSVAKMVARRLQHRAVPIRYTRESVIEVEVFSDGELCPTIRPNVRDSVVFLFWDVTPKDFRGHLNVRVYELLLTLDALRRAKARYVNLILPYFPYARQDRKMKRRQPLSAKLFAEQLENTGIVEQLITFDLHSPQITGFFSRIHVENVPGHVIFAKYVRERFAAEIASRQLSITSTDVGGSKRARDFASEIAPELDIAIVDKRRDESGSSAIKIVGDVSPVMIAYDDIGGTMGSLLDACQMVKKAGAKTVYGAISHNVCSPKLVKGKKKKLASAEAKIAAAGIEVFTLDTLPRGAKYYRKNPLITPIPYHEFIAALILEMISVDGSVSQLIRTWSKV